MAVDPKSTDLFFLVLTSSCVVVWIEDWSVYCSKLLLLRFAHIIILRYISQIGWLWLLLLLVFCCCCCCSCMRCVCCIVIYKRFSQLSIIQFLHFSRMFPSFVRTFGRDFDFPKQRQNNDKQKTDIQGILVHRFLLETFVTISDFRFFFLSFELRNCEETKTKWKTK